MTTSVLIVEDEPSILELISYTCRTSGMEVRKAANVAEAKKNLEAAKPDIILLDWMLPDCAGLEWLYELRRYHSNESLPVIMLTARGQEDDRVRGLEAGADDYVTKPFSRESSSLEFVLSSGARAAMRFLIRCESGRLRLMPSGTKHALTTNRCVCRLWNLNFFRFCQASGARLFTRPAHRQSMGRRCGHRRKNG